MKFCLSVCVESRLYVTVCVCAHAHIHMCVTLTLSYSLEILTAEKTQTVKL